jgi:uncharacterized protein (DUF2235 family)
MKRIVLFCDGTWNRPDGGANFSECQTNVVKMANALAPFSADGITQLLYYDAGIGTEGPLLHRLYDGVTGAGLNENILQAYRFVIDHYNLGDELYLFGFSRGAFTVRSLAGLIRNSGILRRENIGMIPKAYALYRFRSKRYHPKELEATLFRRSFAVAETTRIKFIGVWDTVGALGNPLVWNGVVNSRNRFHDTKLSTTVDFAYQALALNEQRSNFRPSLWHQQLGAISQVLEQVWFVGVHSDIGGGYPESGLSDISLCWMLTKAAECKLSFEWIPTNVDVMAQIHQSYSGFYKLWPRFIRSVDIGTQDADTHESLHWSVFQRINRDNRYRPANLMDYF